MRALAIDTSTKAQSLALTDGDRVVARRITHVRTNHSESLLRNIDDMLAQARWGLSELDLVAAGLGPGTFTGLRVGLATAKALARSSMPGSGRPSFSTRSSTGSSDSPIVRNDDASVLP